MQAVDGERAVCPASPPPKVRWSRLNGSPWTVRNTVMSSRSTAITERASRTYLSNQAMARRYSFGSRQNLRRSVCPGFPQTAAQQPLYLSPVSLLEFNLKPYASAHTSAIQPVEVSGKCHP